MARPEAKLKESVKPSDLKHDVGRPPRPGGDAQSPLRAAPHPLRRRFPVREAAGRHPRDLSAAAAGALPDPDVAIRYALLHPENADPLFAQLNPNMRVTIAIDDISLPLPPMQRPDIRERLLNPCCRCWPITASTTST